MHRPILLLLSLQVPWITTNATRACHYSFWASPTFPLYSILLFLSLSLFLPVQISRIHQQHPPTLRSLPTTLYKCLSSLCFLLRNVSLFPTVVSFLFVYFFPTAFTRCCRWEWTGSVALALFMASAFYLRGPLLLKF